MAAWRVTNTMLPALLCASLTDPVLAQSGPALPRSAETLASRERALRNELGLLRHCQAQGLVSPDAIDRQRRRLSRLPATGSRELDEAEELGRQGIIAFDSSRVPIAAAASGEGVLPTTWCRALGRRLGGG